MSKHVESIFKSHLLAKEVLTTSDGMPFLNAHNAKMHASTLKDKKVTTHSRPKVVKPAVTVMKAEELIEKIGAAVTEKEVDALIEKGEKRKTVLAAVTDAKATIKAVAEDAKKTSETKVEGDPDTTK